MGLSAQLSNFTTLTPPEMSGHDSAATRERHKSMQQRAEDIIYTLNHTFTCLTLTDFFILPTLRGIGLNVGHHHNEVSNEPPATGGRTLRARMNLADNCGDPKHAKKKKLFTDLIEQESAWKRFWKKAGHWMVGEAIGDVGGAAVTIGVQRVFPGFMEGLRSLIEPVAGGFFRRGSVRAAHKWANKHGMAYDSDEVVNRAQELYDYEMRHLPQMGVWTVSSVLLHYGVMKKLENITVADFTKQKVVGAAITAGLVFGARALAPDKAHKWDETAGRHVVVPLTKKVGKLFGIEEHEVDAYHESQRQKEDAPKRWAERVKSAAEKQELCAQAQRA
jgi:hypothetical protein